MQNSEGLVPRGLPEAAGGVMVQETAGGNRAPTSVPVLRFAVKYSPNSIELITTNRQKTSEQLYLRSFFSCI